MTHVDPPVIRTTLGRRLLFFWAIFWAALVTPVFSICFLLNNLFSPTIEVFQRWSSMWARAIFAGVGIKVHSFVHEPIPKDQPVIFVANHQNMLDIIACAAAMPKPYGFLAKAELRKMPFIGRVLQRSACVFVDRSSPRGSVQSLKEAAVQVRSGNSVLVYPEGTRSFGRTVMPFRRGAFLLALEANVPIVPVVQLDNHLALDERIKVASSRNIRVHICKPISTTGYKRSAIQELMDEVRGAMLTEIERVTKDEA